MKIPDYWVRQMMGPFGFNGRIMVPEEKHSQIPEVGPLRPLFPLVKNCIGEGNHLWVPDCDKVNLIYPPCFICWVSFYIKGVDIDWNGFEQGYSHQIVLAPTYPFQREKYWPGISKKEFEIIGPNQIIG